MASVSMAKKRNYSRKAVNEWCWDWFLAAPTIIGLLVLNIVPMIQTFVLSFYKSGDFGRGNIFVGFANYTKMFADCNCCNGMEERRSVSEIVY